MKNLILTALDNNNGLWYENFISFVLSLRETSFNGDIGVIDYGLDNNKKNVLHHQNIKVFPASNAYPELLVDRHISAADIAAVEDYDIIAVFDCDIWFPTKNFTLFEQVTEQHPLYCTYDAWRCSFLVDCVEPEFHADLNRGLDQLESKNGYVWQAGMVVGHKQAWIEYKKYVTEKMTTTSYIKIQYGIDATLINLYAIEKDGIRYLHHKYNCPPVWGVQHKIANGQVVFMVDNQPVECFHITRNHRSDRTITYNNLFFDRFFDNGKAFRTEDAPLYNILPESMLVVEEEGYTKVKIDSAFADSPVMVGVDSGSLYKSGALFIETGGESRFTFSNPHAEPVLIYYMYQGIANFGECARVYLTRNNNWGYSPERNMLYVIELPPGETIAFCTKDLDAKGKRIRWLFDHLRLVSES